MLQKTNGIVLRSIKYGEHSLVTTIFTATYGVQSYMVQGVRKAKQNRAGFFQPGTLLELVVHHQPNKNLQRIREYGASYLYESLHQDVVKNSIVLFSVEVLLRLLPEQAPLPVLFDFAHQYFIQLDKMSLDSVANFPLFFIIHCSTEFGFELKGDFNPDTPHLNLEEGGFSENAPSVPPYVSDKAALILDKLIPIQEYEELRNIQMNADMRMQLIDWYLVFLQRHSQHMGAIKSLSVLRAVLH